MSGASTDTAKLQDFGTGIVGLNAFLERQCEATKAKYAAELEHANGAWRKPLDLRYADSLEFFGLLERLVKPITRKGRAVGSRIWFRKAQKSTTTVNIPAKPQTEAA